MYDLSIRLAINVSATSSSLNTIDFFIDSLIHIFIIANKIKKKRTIPTTTPDNIFNKSSVSSDILFLTRFFANNTIIKKKKRENIPIEANITNFKFRFSRDNSAMLYFYFIQYTDVFMRGWGWRRLREEVRKASL